MTDTPDSIIAVSAALGFVGAFTTEAAVRRLYDNFPSIAFVAQRFPLAADAPADRVWVVPYRDVEAPAVVTNSRDQAEKVHCDLLRVGWTYEGDIDNWEQPVNFVREAVAAHFAAQEAAVRMHAAGPAAVEEAAARDRANLELLTRGPSEDGPLARAIREHERLEIMSCVVPVGAQSE